jgi:glycosyltransferase involved in cell wall biosynthesis
MSLVSVIIYTLNNYSSLKTAIQSVIDQTYKNIEIIILDNQSSDPNYYSGELESFPYTKVIHLEKCINTTFEHKRMIQQIGVQASKGDWICFLEDTDLWYPQKLEKQFYFLSKTPSIFFTCSNYHDDGKPYYPMKYNSIYTYSLGHTNYIYISTVMIHSSVYKSCDWIDLLKDTKCLYIGDSLVKKN